MNFPPPYLLYRIAQMNALAAFTACPALKNSVMTNPAPAVNTALLTADPDAVSCDT